MQLKWKSPLIGVLGLMMSLSSGPAFAAAESSTLQTHSLQDDYSSTMTAQQQSVMSLEKLKSDNHKNYDLTWDLAMREDMYQNPLNKENLFVMRAGLNMIYHMTQNLSVNLAPSFSYFNGYTQTQNEVQGNGSVWTMRNATLDAKAWNALVFSAGALNQQQNSAKQIVHTRVLMDDRSFPGVSAQLSTGGNFDVGLLGEAAIPTSASLTTQTDNQETNPSFQSFGAFMNYKSSRVKLELLADYYSFTNLPSSVAMQSGLLGNTVLAPNGNANSTDNVFAYNYRGLETFGRLKLVLSNYWRFNIDGAYLKNSQAPADSNTATAALASLDWIAAKDIMLTPGYAYFKIQSDAVVASYNDSNFMPNMAGYAGSMTLQYKKSFKLAVSGGERAPLVDNPNQFHEHIWNLKLEMLNVSI